MMVSLARSGDSPESGGALSLLLALEPEIRHLVLTCNEAGVPDAYKDAILGAREHDTRMTRAFSGRPARGIINRFMVEVERAGVADTILPFPLQNALTRPIRNAAARQGRAEFLSLWAGQALRLARRQPAADLVVRLAAEAEAAVARLAK